MPDRGKLVVASIVVIALGLAVFAWYWRWQQGHRAAEFWGAEASQLIRSASQTELLALQPAGEQDSAPATAESSGNAPPSISIEGRRYTVTSTLDLARSPGLIHARHSLTEDASFVWDEPREDCASNWTHALRLTQDGRSAVLALDFTCQRISLVGQGKSMAVMPRIAEGFQRIVQRAEDAQRDSPK